MPHAAGALNGAWSELRLQEVALVPLLVRLGGAVQEHGRSAEEDELGRLARSLDRLLSRGVAVRTGAVCGGATVWSLAQLSPAPTPNAPARLPSIVAV